MLDPDAAAARAVQPAFYLISGSPAWREYALLDRLEHESRPVRSFVVAGADHGLMRTDASYDYAAGGTSLADWIARLVSGESVESVRCDACTTPWGRRRFGAAAV